VAGGPVIAWIRFALLDIFVAVVAREARWAVAAVPVLLIVTSCSVFAWVYDTLVHILITLGSPLTRFAKCQRKLNFLNFCAVSSTIAILAIAPVLARRNPAAIALCSGLETCTLVERSITAWSRSTFVDIQLTSSWAATHITHSTCTIKAIRISYARCAFSTILAWARSAFVNVLITDTPTKTTPANASVCVYPDTGAL